MTTTTYKHQINIKFTRTILYKIEEGTQMYTNIVDNTKNMHSHDKIDVTVDGFESKRMCDINDTSDHTD